MNVQDFHGEKCARLGAAIKKNGFFEPYTIVYIEDSGNDPNKWFIVAERIVPEASMLDKQSTLDRVCPSKGVELYRQTICLKLSNKDIDQYDWYCR